MYCIEIKNLNFKIKDKIILKNIELQLPSNQISGIIGGSGSGKTTLFRILLNQFLVEKYSLSGEIKIFGKDYKQYKKNLIQPIYQDPGLYFNKNWTLEECLDEPLRINFPEKLKNKKELYENLLNEFHISTVRLKDKISIFSGGELQRLSFVRALLNEPQIILLDEPISGLDPILSLEVSNFIKKISIEKKITIVIISHDLDFIADTSDYLVVLNEGEIIQVGTKEEVLTHSQNEFINFLKNSRNLKSIKNISKV